MNPFSAIKNIATIANTVKGISFLSTIFVAAWISVSAWTDQYPTSMIILFGLNGAVSSILLILLLLEIYEKTSMFLTSRREQARIEDQLNNLGPNVSDLDLMTAAGIWANTLASDSIRRHSYFRGLKSAVRSGELKVTHRPVPKHGPSMRVELNSLKDYWRKRGVLQ